MQRLLPLLPLQESPRRKHIRLTRLIQGGGASFPALVQVVRAQSSMKVGILAAGGIAGTMAKTLNNLHHPEVELYAVASRSQERADAFAREYNVPVAYGSYEALAADPQVDLIYIASPHSEHYAHAKLCLEHKKAILVEKAFTANAAQAQEILDLGKSQNTLVTEAIWTRYMPSRAIISHALKEGKIGTPYSIQANLGYPISHKDRIFKPELAGGALLDLGVYPINFAMMFFGHELQEVRGECVKSDTGVDFMDNICLIFKDGKMASLHATAMGPTDRNGIIYGTTGYMVVTNINNPEKVEIFDKNHQKLEELPLPMQVTGYEYQVLSCLQALKKGQIECPEMPHQHTMDVMHVMDQLRQQWQIKYPWE